MIISNKLSRLKEERLIRVLKEHKEVVGWTVANIKGILLSMCMHRILMEGNSKPSRQARQHLNPPVMEVVMKEILKLLDAGVIYLILNSKWVSLVQAIQRK